MTAPLPELAISVRQPWAWAIVHAGKDIENRSAKAVSFGLDRPGRRAVHAAKGMTREEYEDARDFMATIGVACPAPVELQRGGIVGSVTIDRAVRRSDSPWFFGPCGLPLRDAQACAFIPAVGKLGLFCWKPADPSIVPPPARWMLLKPQPTQGQLL